MKTHTFTNLGVARRCVGRLHKIVRLGHTTAAKSFAIWIGVTNPYSYKFGKNCVAEQYKLMKFANTPPGHPYTL